MQIPCIERNALGAVKGSFTVWICLFFKSLAITAAQLSLNGDGVHRVSLDQVIETMVCILSLFCVITCIETNRDRYGIQLQTVKEPLINVFSNQSTRRRHKGDLPSTFLFVNLNKYFDNCQKNTMLLLVVWFVL